MTITSTSALTLKKSYNFSLYPAQLLGNDWKNVLIMAIMDYVTVMSFRDVNALHVQVKPFLPGDVPNDPSKYDWVKVKTSTGIETYLGIPWIDSTTLVEVTKTRLEILVEDTDAGDVDLIRTALTQNGFNKFTITTVQVQV